MIHFTIIPNVEYIGAIEHPEDENNKALTNDFGTSYNSYLIRGSEKTAIVDILHVKKLKNYLKILEQHILIQNIDYLIVNRTEPDYIKSAVKLLELNPELIIVGSNLAVNNVKEIVNKEFSYHCVKEGDTLSLGNKTLQFFNAVMLRWPDTMYTYLIEDNVLFTSDSFSAHYASDNPLQSKIKNIADYKTAFYNYFQDNFASFKSYYIKAISKIESLDINIICPGHGPVLNSDPYSIIEKSKELSLQPDDNTRPLIVIAYISTYGYTEEMAEHIEEALQQYDFDIEIYNMEIDNRDYVIERLIKSDGILIGSPTILGDALFPIWDILIHLNPIEHGIKRGSVFGSYGWSGEGVIHIDQRLKQLKMKTIEPFKLQFKPSQEDLKALDIYVEKYAELFPKKTSKN